MGENEKQIISLVMDDGTIEKVELVLAFQFEDTKKEYVIYTKNEKDANNNVTIYVGTLIRDGENERLLGIETDEEWSRIKDVLRELSKVDPDEE